MYAVVDAGSPDGEFAAPLLSITPSKSSSLPCISFQTRASRAALTPDNR